MVAGKIPSFLFVPGPEKSAVLVIARLDVIAAPVGDVAVADADVVISAGRAGDAWSGGDAWRTDSTELRGIARLGVTKFDAEAMVRRSLNV